MITGRYDSVFLLFLWSSLSVDLISNLNLVPSVDSKETCFDLVPKLDEHQIHCLEHKLLCKYWWAAACTFCRVFNLQHIFFARIAMLWGGKLSAVIVVWCPFQECRTIGFQHLFLHPWFFYANFSSHNSSTVLYFVLSRWVSTPLILFHPAFVVLTCKIKI